MGKKPPSVNNLALSLQNSGIPHELLVEQARSAIAAGDWENIEERVEQLQRSFIQPVVNATGVLLHTNLGRASWESPESNFSSNIEFDLASGNRGSRQTGIGNLFAQLCGAESAMVVNNCSSAVLLVLSALASGKGVAISRSELVEIGGSFRVPEILNYRAQTSWKLGQQIKHVWSTIKRQSMLIATSQCPSKSINQITKLSVSQKKQLLKSSPPWIYHLSLISDLVYWTRVVLG